MLKDKIQFIKEINEKKYLLFIFPLLQSVNIFFVEDYHLRATLSNLIQAFASVFTSFILFILVRNLKLKGEESFFCWNLIFISSVFWSLGMISFMYVEIFLDVAPYPGYPDIFFVMMYPIFAIGISKLPVEKPTSRNKLPSILDLTAFLAVTLLVVWHFNLRFIIENLMVEITGDVLISLIYTILDVAILTAIFYRLTQNLGEGKHFIPTLLLIIGGFFLITADILQGYRSIEGFFYSGSFLDIGWVLFSTFTGLAAISLIYKLDKDLGAIDKSVNIRQYWILGITYVWIVIVFAVMIWAIISDQKTNYSLLIIGSVGAVFLIISRQVLTLKENILLTNQLKNVNIKLEEEIVKQKESEEKVKDALIKEKELNELKTRFISIASHEFRTPLATMYSSTELLEAYQKNSNPEKFKAQLNRIKKSIHHLTEIMDDVLAVSRVDSGKTLFEPVEVNLKNFVEEIIEEAQSLLTSNHKIEMDFPVEIISLKIDIRLFRIILMNLLSNAIKYSPNGGIIRMKLEKSNSFVQISISDQGIGIPESNLKNLFTPFSRADNVENISGTGLGLTIVKKYIEFHNGTIEIETEVNIGTTVTLKLPISEKFYEKS